MISLSGAADHELGRAFAIAGAAVAATGSYQSPHAFGHGFAAAYGPRRCCHGAAVAQKAMVTRGADREHAYKFHPAVSSYARTSRSLELALASEEVETAFARRIMVDQATP